MPQRRFATGGTVPPPAPEDLASLRGAISALGSLEPDTTLLREAEERLRQRADELKRQREQLERRQGSAPLPTMKKGGMVPTRPAAKPTPARPAAVSKGAPARSAARPGGGGRRR